jgi:hypothetical protein
MPEPGGKRAIGNKHGKTDGCDQNNESMSWGGSDVERGDHTIIEWRGFDFRIQERAHSRILPQVSERLE